jgi:TolA-binding protein
MPSHQRTHSPDRSRAVPRGAALIGLGVLLGALAVFGSVDPAPAVTQSEARQELGEISGSIAGLKAQVAEDNRRIDGLIGTLSALRVQAARLTAELERRQARLDRLEAALERERERLRIVRKRLERALAVLRRQLVSLYVAGPPTVAEFVFASEDFSGLVTNSTYAQSIQDHDEDVIARVEALRNEVRALVEKMEERRGTLVELRNAIVDEERRAREARDEVEARRAEFIAARETREARIQALEARAGSLEDSLPDLTSDPASSSAGSFPAPVPGQRAVIQSNGLAAPPAGAPDVVKRVIQAANAIADRPYVWGGGHGSFESSGYDCSGAVSYALHGGGLISSPLDSTGLTTWGEPGEGNWISVYGNSGHVYMVVAGLRWDTSDTGGTGPSWHTSMRSSAGFIPRHPAGL